MRMDSRIRIQNLLNGEGDEGSSEKEVVLKRFVFVVLFLKRKRCFVLQI